MGREGGRGGKERGGGEEERGGRQQGTVKKLNNAAA